MMKPDWVEWVLTIGMLISLTIWSVVGIAILWSWLT